MLRLENWLESWLASQPEYRMGYQKVIAKLNTGGTETGIVVNSQVFLKSESVPWQMLYNDWAAVMNEAGQSALKVIDATLIPREPETLKGIRQIAMVNEKFKVLAGRKNELANFSAGTKKLEYLLESRELSIKAANSAAENAPITLTGAGEIFKRFSAYKNDRRVTSRWGLTPGTFATTKDDADANVKTGTDAVSRYALPNSKPATNVFTITPPSDTDLKRGVAQPAYNQPGGGVEVIFVNGSPDGSVTGPTEIPDK